MVKMFMIGFYTLFLLWAGWFFNRDVEKVNGPGVERGIKVDDSWDLPSKAVPSYPLTTTKGSKTLNVSSVEKKVKPVDRTRVYAKRITDKYVYVHKKDARVVVQEVFKYAKANNLDPVLLLSIISAESSFKRTVVSGMGGVGYTQVVPKYHQKKIRGRDLRDPSVNIEVGAKILRECFDTHRSRNRALGCYNGSSGTEYAKLIQRHSRLFKET